MGRSIIMLPRVGMDLGAARTRWWAKSLKPLGEWEVRDPHHLAQLCTLNPVVRLIIEKLKIDVLEDMSRKLAKSTG